MKNKSLSAFVLFLGLVLLVVSVAGAQGLPGGAGVAEADTESAQAGQDSASASPQKGQPPGQPASHIAPAELNLLVAEADQLWEANDLGNWLTLLVSLALALLAGRILASILNWLSRRMQTRGWRGRRHVFVSLIGPANLALLTLIPSKTSLARSLFSWIVLSALVSASRMRVMTGLSKRSGSVPPSCGPPRAIWSTFPTPRSSTTQSKTSASGRHHSDAFRRVCRRVVRPN